MNDDYDKEDDNDVEIRSFRVTAPAANQPNNVKEMGPGAGYGLLCKCNGNYSKSLGDPFVGLYFKMADGLTNLSMQNVHLAPEKVITASELNFVGNTAAWTLDGFFGSVECSKIAPHPNNKLHLLAVYTQNGTVVYGDFTRVPFQGKCVAACG